MLRDPSTASPTPLHEESHQAAPSQFAADLAEGEEWDEANGHDDAEGDNAQEVTARQFGKTRGDRLAMRDTEDDAFQDVEEDEQHGEGNAFVENHQERARIPPPLRQ